MFIQGYSYGGYLTARAIGHTRRFRAAVVGAPVINLTSMFGTTDVPAFIRYEFAGAPWEVPELYAERSALTYLEDATTPVMIVHWEGDLRCPIGQGEELFTSLRLHGCPAVLVPYPGGSHTNSNARAGRGPHASRWSGSKSTTVRRWWSPSLVCRPPWASTTTVLTSRIDYR